VKTHCNSCGCLYRYSVYKQTKSLAPNEVGRQIFGASSEEKEGILAEIASYGYKTYWIIHYKCTGCSSSQTDFRNAFSEEEKEHAETIVAQHNLLLETPEAIHQAAHWSEEVARRIAFESQQLKELFIAQYPQWTNSIKEKEVNGQGLRIYLSTEISLAKKDIFLEVYNGEVIIYYGNTGWHTHIARYDLPPSNFEHTKRALVFLDDLIHEK
jgi:hypothetical protein